MVCPVIWLDTNAIWHKRIADALSHVMPVIRVAPQSWPKLERSTVDKDAELRPRLVRGWASKLSFIGQRKLAGLVRSVALGADGPSVVVLVSPKYAPLARYLRGEVATVYYCADDYESYRGWGNSGDLMSAEAQLLKGAALSVFVSETLRERACRELGLPRERTFVSPNATEMRFASGPFEIPKSLQNVARPIVGLMGMLDVRSDIELLREVVNMNAVGTLLIAGPNRIVDPAAHAFFKSHPKVIITGLLSHDIMHHYANALDVALIPYAQVPFTHYCSPMRLYDHLATGRPILATDTCDQIARSSFPSLSCVPRHVFVSALTDVLGRLDSDQHSRTKITGIFWQDRAMHLKQELKAVLEYRGTRSHAKELV